MRLVLDTNILISALVRDSVTREILLRPDLELLIPAAALDELDEHHEEIRLKSGLGEHAFDKLRHHLISRCRIVPDGRIRRAGIAADIMGRIDREGVVFLALALSVPNQGIWSNDRHFGRQDLVRVWKTSDLARQLGIRHSPRQLY